MKRSGGEIKITSFFKTKVPKKRKTDDGHDGKEEEKPACTSASTADETDAEICTSSLSAADEADAEICTTALPAADEADAEICTTALPAADEADAEICTTALPAADEADAEICTSALPAADEADAEICTTALPAADEADAEICASALPAAALDVACSIKNKSISDADKLALITQKVPSLKSLPLINEGGHKRRFQPSWYTTYPWLKYSQLDKGGYCIACVLFAGDTYGGQRLGTLVLKPMCKFKKAAELLSSHNTNGFHVTSMTKMTGFVDAIRNPTKAIDTRVQAQKKEQIENNRRVLVPIIESILFCGRNTLPLCGHRDDGRLGLSIQIKTGEGVFRALLRYRAQGGDSDLKHLLTSSTRNSTLISSTIQNELIDITADT